MKYALGLFFLAGMCLSIMSIARGLHEHNGLFLGVGFASLILNTYCFKTNLPAKL